VEFSVQRGENRATGSQGKHQFKKRPKKGGENRVDNGPRKQFAHRDTKGTGQSPKHRK